MVSAFFHTFRVGVGICLFLASLPLHSTATNDLPNNSLASATTEISSPTLSSSTSAILSVTPSDPIDAIFASVQKQWDQQVSEGTTPDQTPLANQDVLPTMQSLGQMLISLALVILLGLTCSWVVKRFLIKKNSLGGEHIEWVSSYTLSQKSKVHLLRVGRDHFLVGEGGNALSLISKVDLNTEPEHDSQARDSLLASPPSLLETEIPTFQHQLVRWQKSLQGRNLHQEVKASLLSLKGLTQRLRRKGGQNA